MCVYIHISDCIEIVYELPLLPNNTAVKHFGTNRERCEVLTGCVEIKCQLDGFFIADLITCSTCFGHHYAHHQGLKSILQVVAACGIWCFGFQVVGLL